MKANTFDKSKFFVFKTILFNNRLRTYKKYLIAAKKEDYNICSLQEFWNDRFSSNKHFILRHDVDDLTPAVKKMFYIEKSLGVHSTYYFRWSTVDKNLIEEMLSAGFEVGLHYETVASYIREHNISNKDELQIAKMQKILKDEIIKFKKEYNPNMISCCSHGAQENIAIGVSSNILLENETYSDYGIKFEAYDKDMYNQCNIYHIMDGNIRLNYGFSYKSNPLDGIDENKQNILFLAHPSHWRFNFNEWIKNFLFYLIGRNVYQTDREFRRIAK